MHRIKKRKSSVFCDSLPIDQTHDECYISDRSRDTAGFVIRVVPTPTEHEFLRVLGEWKRCSARGWSQLDGCEE